MAALSAPRMTNHLGEGAVIQLLRIPLAASTKVWAGSLVMVDAGYLKPAAAGASKKVVGRARATFDNSSGSAGDVIGEVERGTFGWDIGSSGDALTQADVGSVVYAVDDHTVGKLGVTGTAVAEVRTFTPTAANSTGYSLDLVVPVTGGPTQFFNFNIVSDGSATATEIADAFRTVMAADAAFTALVTASGTATLILTRVAAGQSFEANSVGPGVMAEVLTTAAAGFRSPAGTFWQLEDGLAYVESY